MLLVAATIEFNLKPCQLLQKSPMWHVVAVVVVVTTKRLMRVDAAIHSLIYAMEYFTDTVISIPRNDKPRAANRTVAPQTTKSTNRQNYSLCAPDIHRPIELSICFHTYRQVRRSLAPYARYQLDALDLYTSYTYSHLITTLLHCNSKDNMMSKIPSQ